MYLLTVLSLLENAFSSSGYGLSLRTFLVRLSNSTSPLPAFTPQQVMTSGMGIGRPGQWMNNCTTVPSAPCGRQMMIGNLRSNLTSVNESKPSVSRSATPAVTGSASTFRVALKVVVRVAIGAALI